MKAQTSIEFLLIASAVAALCLGVVTLYSKNIFAQDSALSRVANQTATVYNFSSFPNPYNEVSGNPSTQYAYSASIVNRSEWLVYNLSAPAPVISLYEFSHCTYSGFFGHPGNVSGQCGTANAWDYRADYPCATTGTFCIIPENTSYATVAVSPSRAYRYNFTLEIGSPMGVLQAQMYSGEVSSPLVLSGNTVGSASVVDVGSVEPEQSLLLMGNANGYAPVNQSAYEQYAQAKNLLYPMLGFYNSTWISGSTQAQVQQAVNAFGAYSLALRGSEPLPTSCVISGNGYTCPASFPLFYVINVTLAANTTKQTLYYLGSAITLRGS